MDRRIHFRPTVEADETLYAYTPADNGADPLWCYGSTCIVADDAQVYVAGLETVPDTLPPNNVRWVLYRRSRGWQSVFTDVGHLTREPCPLGYSRGRLWLSANPAVQPIPGKWALPAQPQILEFSASSPTAGYSVSLPDWGGELPFTEHSYRGMAVDGPQGEILLLNINGHTAQQWVYRNGEGLWAAHGQLAFPWSMEDSVALRLCYPNVALAGGQAVVVGVSDIVEPHADWKAAKFEITRRDWDYVFRRLYYAWTPAIGAVPFSGWVEIANQERFAGHIRNEDALIDARGAVHLLWTEQSVDTRIRSRFFPGVKNRVTLEHAVLERGAVAQRQTLCDWNEDEPGERPMWARFHAMPDGRLVVLVAMGDHGPGPSSVARNALFALLPGGGRSEAVTLDLAEPLTRFMVATPRSGSAPSDTIHAIGQHEGEHVIRYIRVRLN